jgi:hypothetical protein
MQSIYYDPLMRSSWTDEQLNLIRDLRKINAQQEGNPLLSKLNRKECQRYVKACTILIEYFYGTGRFVNKSSANDFPLELEDHMYYALSLL